MVLNYINVSSASTPTCPPYPPHPHQPPTRRHRYQSQLHAYDVPPPNVHKGCPLPLFKGWPIQQQPKSNAPPLGHHPPLCSLLVQSYEHVLPTENSMRARLSLLTPSISITKSNTTTATARNLINSNSVAIRNALRNTPP